ncbi:auxin-responsive protein SAUR64-like protein [Cinnamomum micranthum f. kanehirae]|uniref:Auxin-responsive protein SAUR64-like protein n=1 Tax=Cinnamomum micranthum f. kanehirae TaxID=337451 RepID=A0A443P1E0_9MAGN|nr:auxin-responsive protein SAUR64-like protein [Cinnamomum micranthum f. kanehirae]
MIDSKRLVAIFKKWQKISVTGRRRISMDRKFCNKSVAAKGHFVVYTVDGRRFVLPLQHLKSPVFIELFRMSEEAFRLKDENSGSGGRSGVCFKAVLYLPYIVKLDPDSFQAWKRSHIYLSFSSLYSEKDGPFWFEEEFQSIRKHGVFNKKSDRSIATPDGSITHKKLSVKRQSDRSDLQPDRSARKMPQLMTVRSIGPAVRSIGQRRILAVF